MNKQLLSLLRGITFSIVVFLIFLVITKELQPTPITVSTQAEEAPAFYVSPSSDYYLTGDMEMYPGVFLMPSAINSSNTTPLLISDLSEIRRDECRTEDSYTATIRFFISSSSDEYAMILPGTMCEYLVFVNGETVANSATIRAKTPAFSSPTLVAFPLSEEIYEVVIIAITPVNSLEPTSKTIIFGQKEHIEKINTINFAAVTIVFAIILVTILFALIQLLAIKKERLIMSFILLSLAVLCRIAFSGDVTVMKFFPRLSYRAGTITAGLTMPFLMSAVVFHFFSMFPSLFPRKIINIVLLAQLIPFFNVVTNCRYVVLNVTAIVVYFFVYSLCYYVVFKAYSRKYANSTLFVLGLNMFTLCGLLELITSFFPISIHFPQFYPFVMFSIVEIIILAQKYNDQQNAEQFYTDELTKTLEAMQSSENAFLNAQMKPHFLYNTLNTIADLCVCDPDKAQKLINTLTEYLKLILSIDNMEKTVPLSQEMELAISYTKIEKERFPSINFYTDFPVSMPSISLPPLTLQPLIENAIKHGVRKSDKPAAITLRIRESYDNVTFYVSDNGVGMDEDTIKKLFNEPKENKSIGIYNIDKRLNNLYNTHLEVDSTIGLGTCISFSVPR